MSIMLSGGKDSTVMTHLACVDMGLDLPVFSVQSDLEYPGEKEYIINLANEWKFNLILVVPEKSAREWIAETSAKGKTKADDNYLNPDLFDIPLEKAEKEHGKTLGIMLGLRADESRGRLENRRFRGAIYQKRDGRIVCNPLSDWSGIDVMAYAMSRDIDPQDIYKCVAFMDRDEPWMIRAHWWLPGAHAHYGRIAWLKHYYPSLYRQLVLWWPEASMMA